MPHEQSETFQDPQTKRWQNFYGKGPAMGLRLPLDSMTYPNVEDAVSVAQTRSNQALPHGRAKGPSLSDLQRSGKEEVKPLRGLASWFQGTQAPQPAPTWDQQSLLQKLFGMGRAPLPPVKPKMGVPDINLLQLMQPLVEDLATNYPNTPFAERVIPRQGPSGGMQ